MTKVYVCSGMFVDNMQPSENSQNVEAVFLKEEDAVAWVEAHMAEHYDSEEDFEDAQGNSCGTYVEYFYQEFDAQ